MKRIRTINFTEKKDKSLNKLSDKYEVSRSIIVHAALTLFENKSVYEQRFIIKRTKDDRNPIIFIDN